MPIFSTTVTERIKIFCNDLLLFMFICPICKITLFRKKMFTVSILQKLTNGFTKWKRILIHWRTKHMECLGDSLLGSLAFLHILLGMAGR